MWQGQVHIERAARRRRDAGCASISGFSTGTNCQAAPPATFAVNVGDGPPIAYANGLFTGVRTPGSSTPTGSGTFAVSALAGGENTQAESPRRQNRDAAQDEHANGGRRRHPRNRSVQYRKSG